MTASESMWKCASQWSQQWSTLQKDVLSINSLRSDIWSIFSRKNWTTSK